MSGGFELAGKKVWVAGHRGMVGSAIVRRLEREDCIVLKATRQDADLRRQVETEAWMAENKPDVVFLAAATVGGILANDTRPAEFIYDNLAIETNVINTAWKQGVQKLMMMGSACIYPKHTPQPMVEEALLTGPLEPTNEWYAVAKIAGIKMCQAYRRQYGCDFISAQPNNLYGASDNFDLRSSHVIPALIRKAHEAKVTGAKAIQVWGTGRVLREFLHVDDLADAAVFLMKNYSDEVQINVGTGEELSIAELARLVCEVVGFRGGLEFDTTRPDGVPRKLLATNRLTAMGWKPTISLRDGLAATYAWYRENDEALRS